MVPAATPMPATLNGANSAEPIGIECRKRDSGEHHQDTQLDQHHHGVDLRRLAGTADQQHCAQRNQDDRGQVDQARGGVAHGAAERAWGRRCPKKLSSSLLRYSLQPTATAAVDTRIPTEGMPPHPSPPVLPASYRRRSTSSRRPARLRPVRRSRERPGRGKPGDQERHDHGWSGFGNRHGQDEEDAGADSRP